jgi:hypothetical protein
MQEILQEGNTMDERRLTSSGHCPGYIQAVQCAGCYFSGPLGGGNVRELRCSLSQMGVEAHATCDYAERRETEHGGN